MKRDAILAILRNHRSDLASKGVRSVFLFGSVARDEAALESDVDLLVDFDRPIGLFDFIGLQQHLERVLGCRVDLVPKDGIKPLLRQSILEGAIPVA